MVVDPIFTNKLFWKRGKLILNVCPSEAGLRIPASVKHALLARPARFPALAEIAKETEAQHLQRPGFDCRIELFGSPSFTSRTTALNAHDGLNHLPFDGQDPFLFAFLFPALFFHIIRRLTLLPPHAKNRPYMIDHEF